MLCPKTVVALLQAYLDSLLYAYERLKKIVVADRYLAQLEEQDAA